MLPLTRIQLLSFAAAGALVAVALTTASTPARSYEQVGAFRTSRTSRAHSHDGRQ